MNYSLEFLSELAVKNLIEGLTEFSVYVTNDPAPLERPCVLVCANAVREIISPGSGVLEHVIHVTLQHNLCDGDDQTESAGMQERVARDWQSLRQVFYRDDLAENPMRDLAVRLDRAVAQPYGVYGVTLDPELGPSVDDAEKIYQRGLVLKIRATAVDLN